MAIQLINIGQIANDGTGDDLREAMIKINANFEELDLRDDEKTTASNLGSIGQGLFVQRLNYDLQFKRIRAGNNVYMESDGEKVTISVPTIGVESLILNADTGTGQITTDGILNIEGGDDISTSFADNTFTINYDGVTNLEADPAPTLSTNLNADGNSLLNVGVVNAASVTGSFTGNLVGNVTGDVHDIDIRDIWRYFEPGSSDFGAIEPVVRNIIEFIILNQDIEMGSITNPNSITFEQGSLI